MGIGNEILNGTHTSETSTLKCKPKLIIHETDCHGCGYIIFNGDMHYYSYDGSIGDMRAAVQYLLDIGFIKEDEVIIFEGDEIYNIIEKYYNGEG